MERQLRGQAGVQWIAEQYERRDDGLKTSLVYSFGKPKTFRAKSNKKAGKRGKNRRERAVHQDSAENVQMATNSAEGAAEQSTTASQQKVEYQDIVRVLTNDGKTAERLQSETVMNNFFDQLDSEYFEEPTELFLGFENYEKPTSTETLNQ
jgi:hypothetical protein